MKKVTIGLLLCGMVLSTGVMVNAEGASTSKGKVEFISGGTDETVTPIPNPDPDPDPDPDPVKPTDPTEPGNNGPLKFVSLPNVDFGKVELAPYAQKYYAQFEKRSYSKEDGAKAEGLYPTTIAVQDLRGGAKGWTVTASHNGVFTKMAGDKTKTVKAYLGLKDGHIKTNTFTGDDVAKYSPATLVKADAYTEISSENGGSQVPIFKAEKGQGYGKWALAFGSKGVQTSGKGLDGTAAANAEGTVNNTKKGLNPSVRMTVPTQVIDTDEGGSYETTITWTLSNVI